MKRRSANWSMAWVALILAGGTTALGQTATGDLDSNGEVNLVDLAVFIGCMNGPGGGVDPVCDPGHFDPDPDIDLRDFAGFQRRFGFGVGPPRIDRFWPTPGEWIVDDIGLTQIQVGFTEPVTAPPDSVFLWTIDLTQITEFATSYDGGTNTLTITPADAIRDTRLNVLLNFTITDAGGNELDGEIDDPSNPSLPSGDGFRGGQAVLRFNILQGDANRDGVVDQTDAAIIRESLGLDENDAGFDPLADLNLDGVVNAIDSAIFREAEGRTIPQTDGDPPVIVGIFQPPQKVFEPFDTVTIELSEPVVPLHLSEWSAYLIDVNGDIHVPRFYGQGAFGDILDFFFIPPLEPCGTYTINLTNGMADVSGELIRRPSDPPVITGIVKPPCTCLVDCATPGGGP